MIGALLSGLFNLILTLVGTVIQIVLLPINALFNGVFPDLSQYLTDIATGFTQILAQIGWIISIIPTPVKTTLILIFTIEISIITILRSTKLTAKLWTLLQKLKFW